MWDNATETQISADDDFFTSKGISQDLAHSTKLAADSAIGKLIQEIHSANENGISEPSIDSEKSTIILDNFHDTTIRPLNILISFFLLFSICLFIAQNTNLIDKSEYILIPQNIFDFVKANIESNTWTENQTYYYIHIPLFYLAETIILSIVLFFNNSCVWLNRRSRGKPYPLKAKQYLKKELFTNMFSCKKLIIYYFVSILISISLYFYADIAQYYFIKFTIFTNTTKIWEFFDYQNNYFLLQTFNFFNSFIFFILKHFKKI